MCTFYVVSLAVCIFFIHSFAPSFSVSFRVPFCGCLFVGSTEATVSVLNDEPTNRLVACMHRTKRSCKQFKISVPSSNTYFAVRSNNSRDCVFFINTTVESTSTQVETT